MCLWPWAYYKEETLAIEAIKTKLDIQDDFSIERAHRVGKPRPPFRRINGAKVPSKPRTIAVRFLSWKEKERVVRAVRRIKPDGLNFFEDFSKKKHLNEEERRSQNLSEKERKIKTCIFSRGQGCGTLASKSVVNMTMIGLSLALGQCSKSYGLLFTGFHNLSLLLINLGSCVSVFTCSVWATFYWKILPVISKFAPAINTDNSASGGGKLTLTDSDSQTSDV